MKRMLAWIVFGLAMIFLAAYIGSLWILLFPLLIALALKVFKWTFTDEGREDRNIMKAFKKELKQK